MDGQGVQRVKDVSFDVRAGEIVGIAGVAGNGQSELLEALSGIRSGSGRVAIEGRALDMAAKPDPAMLRKRGLAHVPEDRQRMGLVTAFTAYENNCLGYQDDPAWNRMGFMDFDAIRRDVQVKIADYDVRPPNCYLKAASFSGGNQQKIVLAREIERDPALLLVGQPTRGVDIGAIEFIHRRLIELRDAGKAILLVSVELEEILSLSDRVLVMFDGRIVGTRVTAEADEGEIGLLMAGVSEAGADSMGAGERHARGAVARGVRRSRRSSSEAAQTWRGPARHPSSSSWPGSTWPSLSAQTDAPNCPGSSNHRVEPGDDDL